MKTKLKLVRIGNSKGVRLPAAFLKRYHFGETVRVTETPDGLLLEPEQSGKFSLEESFAAMGRDGKAMAEAREWAESGLAEGLADEEFPGWPR